MAGQIWVTNSLGGYMYSDQLSKTLRFAVQPGVKFRQFADIKDAADGCPVGTIAYAVDGAAARAN